VLKCVIACSLLTLSFTLAGCNILSNNPQNADTGATAQARWSEATARQLREAIDRRAAHGLDRVRFVVEGQPGNADGQEALTQSALRYARALAQGASDPSKLYTVYTVSRPKPEVLSGLAKALTEGKLGDWFDSVAPQDNNYVKLSEAYLALRKQGNAATPAIQGSSAPLKPGATEPRIPAIADQLVASDYLDRAAAQGERYNPAMVKAVQRMQADYGIKPDGVIGSEALEILNLSDGDRARAIAVAMERRRWLDRDAPATRIDVNLSSATLT
jgi:L,D-transpeptidase YcbB